MLWSPHFLGLLGFRWNSGSAPKACQQLRWRLVIRILLVEDDNDIAGRLATGLRPAGFVVDRAQSGEDGYEMGAHDQFDAAILDLGLPNMQGLAVLRKWRAAKRDMPVLILTAHGTWTEKVEGLNAGADDYITKPFHIPEVVARLRALIRRKSGAANPLL
ncbi:MAG: response regulator transcription factor, partial [Hyphomicrobium sp.]